MSEIIFDIIYQLANVALLICLIFSFYISKRKYKSRSYRIIHWYLVIALFNNVIIDVVRFFIPMYLNYSFFFLLLFSTFHFSILTFYIIILLNKKSLLISIFYFLIISVLFYYNYYDIQNSTYYSATISNIGLIFFSLIYYFDLIKYSSKLDLKVQPSFFVISGIFFSSALMLPILLFGGYLHLILNSNLFYLLAILAPISSISMYIFFIKSFLCIRRIKV